MDAPLEGFRSRLYSQWLPTFCNDSKRNLATEGFVDHSVKVTDVDARNFIRAMDCGVIRDLGGGRYRCARSSASEQLFWEGARAINPRRLTLWVEPVITIATIGRLHLDFGWPTGCLCMQSRTWAFDFAAFASGEAQVEQIVGEVKKSVSELDRMIDYIKLFAAEGTSEEPASGAKRNAFRKWRALRDSKVPLFWAVGPNDYTHLYAVEYPDAERAVLKEVPLAALAFRSC